MGAKSISKFRTKNESKKRTISGGRVLAESVSKRTNEEEGVPWGRGNQRKKGKRFRREKGRRMGMLLCEEEERYAVEAGIRTCHAGGANGG